MTRTDKENSASVDAPPPPAAPGTLKHASAKRPTEVVADIAPVSVPRTRKRALAESTADNSCVDQLVTKAKHAIKRRCAEMGIRRFASLSAKHAKEASGPLADVVARPIHKHSSASRKYPEFSAPDSESSDPASEATIILLSSEAGTPEDVGIAPRVCATPSADSTALESQITLVAPSSPPLLPSHVDCDVPLCALPPPPFKPGILAPTPANDDDMPSTYAELAEWLLGVEKKYSLDLKSGMSRHPELSSRMRPILVDWLMEVSTDYRMHRQTLHLTVQYLDRFLANTDLQVEPGMLQCYGTACLSIAMKAEEQRAPSLSELTDFSKDAFTRDQLKQAEIDVLAALGWHLAVPTLFEFLCLVFQRAAVQFPSRFADQTRPSEPEPKDKAVSSETKCPATTDRCFDARLFMVACDYADALLHCQDSLRYSASELAAACFYLGTAPNSLDGSTFAACTGYSFTAVWPVILHVKRLKVALAPESATHFRGKQCCETKDRYSNHLKRIRPAELWAFQPHHAHLLREFEDAFPPR
ncbi:G1/S-specific cyclin-E2 [Coemansia sp. RSA 2675]|uniref:G1/S-specific cyclin-E2 n=1 Tax=Coemansia linderi TaxID=2663919 RepID=A0ACC1KCC4_9FUNG|nr:G1/S-specific cyclin-E2 [Coemansia sp. RSA 2675]KAJ2782515.1 G1/S-specific cyclin-E2 [Coemansia linderi]